jgi:hypothetical protein
MTRAVSALMGAILADELSKRGVRNLAIAECETIAATMVLRTADAAPPVRIRKAGVVRPQHDNEGELRRMPLQVRPLPPAPPLAADKPTIAWPILASLLLMLLLLTTAVACAFHDVLPFCVRLTAGDVAGACWGR